jgi:hypothetical protein
VPAVRALIGPTIRSRCSAILRSAGTPPTFEAKIAGESRSAETGKGAAPIRG